MPEARLPSVLAFDLMASASDPTGMAGEEAATLGGIGASQPWIEEIPLPELEVEID